MMVEFDRNALNIYTDGSAKPNPGVGGIAIIVEFPENSGIENKEISFGYKKSTNNRMELIACIDALKILNDKKREWGRLTGNMRIITDSSYAHDHGKYNVEKWRSNHWKNKDGREILNKDLWKLFLTQKERGLPKIELTKGKKTLILKRVDELAKKAKTYPIKRIDSGFIAEKNCRSLSPSGKTSLYPANNQTEIIHTFGRKLVGSLYRIRFDLYNFEENVYEGKFFAFITIKQKETIHTNHWYKVTFNKSESHPTFVDCEDWDGAQ